MKFKAKQIADIIGGELVGNPEAEIWKMSKIEDGETGSITFFANPKYEEFLYTSNADVILINKSFELKQDVKATLIKVEDAYQAIAQLLNFYYQLTHKPKQGIEQPSFISQSAKVGENPYIGAFAYIGNNVKIGNNVQIFPHAYIGDNCTIDDDSIIYSGVKIYQDCVIGKACTLHSGVVIGADGFGFAPKDDKNYMKVPQIGNVILEDGVEIGANTCVDRATMGSTVLKKGVKLDNLIQIAHNCEIGESTVIAAQTGIAGSTKMGKYCMIGGQVGIVGHLKLGDGVKIAAQSGIQYNLADEAIVQGSPAFNYKEYKKSYEAFKNLPTLLEEIKNK